MIHRTVNFRVSTLPYGGTVCGATDGEMSGQPSGYDCMACGEGIVPAQLLSDLEKVLRHEDYDRMPVPTAVISHLDTIANLLKVERGK